MDKKFIINIKGKDFIRFEGLLDAAHNQGLCGVDTTLIQVPNKDNGMVAIVQAVSHFNTKNESVNSFSGLGDASPTNVNSMIVPHIIRQAETRSVARSLRLGTNIGMCSAEELGNSESDSFQKVKDVVVGVLACSKCNNTVFESEKEYSMKYYGVILCRACQKKVKKL